ncbi:hypothetical protein B0H17DRAFT_1145917 [Mycena rosella]|uniref:Uncharacterized protein n=1 Tax=Mycena rosella TaxID=1033263 RepID=A0AAD7G3Z8_MYCRO|nr:hypothetical protein B0H17DRAFT_1145917 [Mycena rosella]
MKRAPHGGAKLKNWLGNGRTAQHPHGMPVGIQGLYRAPGRPTRRGEPGQAAQARKTAPCRPQNPQNELVIGNMWARPHGQGWSYPWIWDLLGPSSHGQSDLLKGRATFSNEEFSSGTNINRRQIEKIGNERGIYRSSVVPGVIFVSITLWPLWHGGWAKEGAGAPSQPSSEQHWLASPEPDAHIREACPQFAADGMEIYIEGSSRSRSLRCNDARRVNC